MNFAVIALAALIPPVLGFCWYHKMLFGKAWRRTSNLRESDLVRQNKVVVYATTYVLSFMLALVLNMLVVHQFHIYSILAKEPAMKDPNSALSRMVQDFMAHYGHNYRTFKHGAFHGTIAGLFLATPIIGINAIFERKGFTYVAIHAGFWMAALALMGGVLCQFV